MNNQADVPALAKGVQVLEAIAGDSAASRSVSALAARLGIPQASCYRIVRTLERLGWLRPLADGAGHELGPALRSLAGDRSVTRRLRQIAQPALSQLADKHGLTFKLSVRSGDEALVLARAEPNSPFVITGQVGARFHLCFGSVGPTLLLDASDDEVRRLCATAPDPVWRHQSPRQFRQRLKAARLDGHCIDRGSYHPDIHGLSVPIRIGPAATAALTVIATASTLPPERINRFVAAMRNTATACQQQLQSSPGIPAT